MAVLITLGWFLVPTSESKDGKPDPRNPETEPRTPFAADRADGPGNAPGRPGRSEFAAGRGGEAAAAVPFDGRRAMGYLKDICDLGPRQCGSRGMKRQQELLRKHFEALGGTVTEQNFTGRQRSTGREVAMTNLIVSWHPERLRRVILCSHYDTRPIADQEPDPRRWRQPFLSANDGGSGVALLMELAHRMKDLKTAVGVDFVFFDGEEFIDDPDRDQYFLGSEQFARVYTNNKPKHRYTAAVLMDMIGGKNARFPAESYSLHGRLSRPLVVELWQIAAEQKCNAFLHEEGPPVRDDHLALNRAGIPAVDIIDFSYVHWHRLTDTPENCSAASLEQVARVLTVWLQRVK
jgi:hypothetical protein